MNIAIITGASSGLGRAFFENLPKVCPDLEQIWLVARRAERLQDMAATSAVPVTVLPMDLTDPAAYDTLAHRLAAEKPTVRVLINNAGVGELDNMRDSDWPTQCRMVDLNCRALTAVTTVVLPYVEPGRGHIINVASIASFVPTVRMTVYASTKAYVLSLSKGLREELRPLKVNVLALCPGPMDTEFLTVANITGRSDTFKRLPYADPDKVAKRALKKAAAGRAVYTPLMLFKLYRVLAKLLPHSLMMKLCKT